MTEWFLWFLVVSILVGWIAYSCGYDVGWYRGHSDAVWKLMRFINVKGEDYEENNDPADNDSDADGASGSGRDKDPLQGEECGE
jgi:hypothetical protein